VKADNPFDLLLPAAMAKVAEEAGVYKATKHPMKTFYLAITAGVFISIAFVSISPRPPALPRCLSDCQTDRWDLLLTGSDSVRYLRCRPLYLNRSYRGGESQRSNYLGSTGKKLAQRLCW
jgi:hypothetical protein